MSESMKANKVLGYPVNYHAFLDSGRSRPDDKASVLAERLRELPSGLSEWALHSGIATEELGAVMVDPKVEGDTKSLDSQHGLPSHQCGVIGLART
jgi:hypothetical protein